MKRLFSWLASNFVQSNKDSKRRKADDTGVPGSSATPKGSNSYDVFLSFRGTDTRNTFVDHLYNNLVDAGICVFKDDDELCEGEEISTNLLAAIKNSKISIPVLSQNYAWSKGCLQELVQMIECMKNAGQVVLPIFYRVEPTDVRHQKGSFREAFSHLRGKYSEEDVAKWKEALQEVASLKGWESEKIANGEIVRQEDYNAPMNRSRLWAQEEALEVLKRNKGIEKLQIQAFHFDKYLFNSTFTTVQLETLPNLRFLQVCVANLNGDSKSLLWLHLDKCFEFVATSFRLEKLVILDLSGSTVSKDWEGWSHLKVTKELKVLKLGGCFCLKATPDLSAFQNLEILVLANCISLEKIHHSIGEVRGLVFLDLSACSTLQVLPEEMGKLKELKELNICKTQIKEIPPWIGSMKGLISLDFSGCKELRVLPREMGKLEELEELNIDDTTIEEIPPCIGSLKKLKILHAHDCKLLVGLADSITHLVNLSTLDLSGCISLDRLPENIGSLVNLQRLSLGSGRYTLGKRIDYTLLWLTKINYGSNGFPSNAIEQRKRLIRPYLHGAGIRELPKSIGDLMNLKILDITASELKNLPSTIGKLGNLEELHASQCRNLEGEISIEGLSSLKILVLSWTSISSFSDTYNKLSRLEKLDLCGCKMLQSLPKSMSELPSLQCLQLIKCYQLRSLPKLPGCLTDLEITCQHRTLAQLSHLIHLKEFTVYKCKLLESMPELPSAILKLSIYNCDKLKELPSLSSLELLSQLKIENCHELTEIKGLEALKSLVHLSVLGSKKLSKFDVLEHAESLGYLDMSFSLVNDDLIQVQGVDRLKNLEKLDICSCEYLIRPDLSQLTHLKQLRAKYCHNLVEIKGLERLENLERLDIEGCTSIETLPDLSCFDNLKYLNIEGCAKLRDDHGIKSPT